jgi:uncharacterized protein (DUF1778 family)
MGAVKEERLAVRMTAGQKRTIERAAELLGRNVSEFSVEVLTEKAGEVLADRSHFGVDQATWDDFLARLDEPARPVKELVELFRRPTVFEE